METEIVGKVLVSARIENLFDLERVAEGLLPEIQVRRIDVDDARIETGSTYVAMPRSLIDQLGLRRLRSAQAKTATGLVTFGIYGPVKLTIQGRDCVIEVSELAEGCPVLMGFIPLEMLDFVIDPKGQRLIGNPEHGGEWIFDLL